MLCPSSQHLFKGSGDYAGVEGSSLSGLTLGVQKGQAWEVGVLRMVNPDLPVVSSNQRVAIRDVTDGTNSTFIVVEDAGRSEAENGAWAWGAQCLSHDTGTINSSRNNEIFSDHPSGANVLMTDASVHFLNEEMEPFVIGALSTRNAGEQIEADKWH